MDGKTSKLFLDKIYMTTPFIIHVTNYKLMLIIIIALFTTQLSASSTLADFTFKDPKQLQAFRNLTEQLRCLVCQNESLAASQAELAQDLRREVYAMMQAGNTEEQIINFLVARYGDFVLYSPPVKPSTYFLWYGPFVLFGLAGLWFIRTLWLKSRLKDTGLSPEKSNNLSENLPT